MLAQRLINTECKGCKQRSNGAPKGVKCQPHKCIPREVREAFFKAAPQEEPELKLWREVAARAVLDACGFVESAEERAEAMAEARAWFSATRTDRKQAVRDEAEAREETFLLAGVDHDTVVKAILIHIDL